MHKLLSFIVTFHNGKDYIGDCLDSLLEQDIPKDEYEIIIVDDCSDPEYGIDIINKYEDIHSNVFVIHNEKNLRTGASRNKGVMEAHGEYVWFIDQDDFIEKNSVRSLIEKCKNNSLDILYFDFIKWPSNVYAQTQETHISYDSSILSGIELIDYLSKSIWGKNNYFVFLWHALYNRDFLIANNIWNPEIYAHEDVVFSFQSLISAKRTMAVNKVLYYYRQVESSDFHKLYNIKAKAIFCGSLVIGDEFLKLAESIMDKSPTLSNELHDSAIFAFNRFTKGLLSIQKNEKKDFFKLLDNYEDHSYEKWISPFNKFLLNHRCGVIHFSHVLHIIWFFLRKTGYSYIYDGSKLNKNSYINGRS